MPNHNVLHFAWDGREPKEEEENVCSPPNFCGVCHFCREEARQETQGEWDAEDMELPD